MVIFFFRYWEVNRTTVPIGSIKDQPGTSGKDTSRKA